METMIRSIALATALAVVAIAAAPHAQAGSTSPTLKAPTDGSVSLAKNSPEMDKLAAPAVSDVQQLQFVNAVQAVEIAELRAQQARDALQKYVATLQRDGYDLKITEGRLEYVKKAPTAAPPPGEKPPR